MSEGVGRELKPVKFDAGNNKSAKSPMDQFGQQYNTDADKSKFSDESPADSRRYHTRADTDTSPRSLHHTLGMKHSQASPGDHNHDGSTSRKIGPLEMDPANPGKTRPVWVLPASPTVADLVILLKRFVEVR